MQNYYQILGVSTNATEQEIRTSYIEKIKKYHPDTFDGDKTFAEQQTALITEAYTTLKDATLRKRYDLRNNISSAKPNKQEPKQQKPNWQHKNKPKTAKTEPNKKKQEKPDKADNKGEKKDAQNKETSNIKAEKPKYTKRQLVQDIFIGVLSALLIFILGLAIF